MAVRTIEDLRSLDDFALTPGFASLPTFARLAFAPDAPRFLRGAEGELTVYRSKDLQALGTMHQVGAVPPRVLFGAAWEALEAGQAAPGSALADVIASQVFAMNPPLHKPLRRTIANCFGPKQVKAMEELARSVAAASLDAIDPAGPVDGLRHFGEAITCRFFGLLLGMDDAEIAEMEGYIRDFTAIFLVPTALDHVLRYDAAAKGYKALLERTAQRGLAGGDALVTALSSELEAVREMGLPQDPAAIGIVPASAGALLAGNLVDGYHTAAVGITNVLYVLGRHPAAMEAIRADRSLVLPAIFEALRLAPPVIALKRWALEDFAIDGLHVPAGATIAMMWGAGGYDPAQFPDPESFSLDRSRQGSTTFGGGLHLCPGRYLAPMLARTVVDQILDRGLSIDPQRIRADWIDGTVLSQLAAFELEFRQNAA